MSSHRRAKTGSTAATPTCGADAARNGTAYSACAAANPVACRRLGVMTAPVDLREFAGQGDVLKPYVPRLLIEWVRDSPEIPYRQVEGSLAFVDISGFTALTERLARRGKVGAEILRDTLDGVFNALLDEAYLWGAGLIKWGGDALLLLYDGPGHEARAARAAWEMQRTIERVGRLRVGCRHRDASDVDRDHDRADRLLHGRERPSGAARRRAGRDGNGRDRGRRGRRRDRPQSRARASPRRFVCRAAEGRRSCCSSRPRRPSSIRRRTSGRWMVSTWPRAFRSRRAPT